MAAIQINRTVDLSKMVQPEALTGVTFTEESGGHEFVLTAKDAVLSGTVKARFMRGDGSTQEFYGSTVDGVAHLTLTADCYEVAGRFLLTVFYDGGDGMAVIYAAVGHVVKSSNGAVTPSQPAAQSFEDILAGYVQQMTNATSAANTAADAASSAAADAESVVNSSVRYDVEQTLADAQKETARNNIDACSQSEADDLKSAISGITTATAEDEGKALIAKTVNDGKVTEWEFGEAGSGLSDDIKSALLQLAQKVTYADENGTTYYNDLRDALYPPADLVRIEATYNQSKTVYTTDELNVLIDDLTVSAVWSDGTRTTLSSSDYTLSGTLAEGESAITVSYEGKTATFTVTVTYKEGQRYLTINDVVEKTGFANMTVSDGTLSFDSAATFSIYEIDPGVLPLITGFNGSGSIVSNKIDENNYIGYDIGGRRFRFTKTTGGSNYNATAESGNGEMIKTGGPQAPYVVDIVNGTLTLTGANNSGKIEYTYANCFGAWCSSSNTTKLTNCEVNYDGSI